MSDFVGEVGGAVRVGKSWKVVEPTLEHPKMNQSILSKSFRP